MKENFEIELYYRYKKDEAWTGWEPLAKKCPNATDDSEPWRCDSVMLPDSIVCGKKVQIGFLGITKKVGHGCCIDDVSIVETKEVRRGQRFMDQAVNDWILTLSKEQLKSFVDTLFSLVYALGVEDLLELNEDKKTRILNMLSAMKELDDESKQGMKKVLGALFEIMGKQALKEIDEKWKHIQKH